MKVSISGPGRFLRSWWAKLGMLVLASWIAYEGVLAPSLNRLDRIERKEPELKTVFSEKQHKAVNLDSYKEQMTQMQEMFGAFLRQLPDRFETVELQADIGRLAAANGVELVDLEFLDETDREFYATRNALLTLRAPFPKLAALFDQLSRQQRILAPDVLRLDRRRAGSDVEAVLEFRIYRYLDEAESDEIERRRNGPKPRRRS